MSFFDTAKGAVCTVFETVSGAAQSFIEQQRTNAKLNKLRSIMKSESELMNRAYIALGKDYYEQIKKGVKPASEREEKLSQLIDNCKTKIGKARERYREIIESQNDYIYQTVNCNNQAEETEAEPEEEVDITVACSNENEYPEDVIDSKSVEKAAEEAVDEILDDESPDGELF